MSGYGYDKRPDGGRAPNARQRPLPPLSATGARNGTPVAGGPTRIPVDGTPMPSVPMRTMPRRLNTAGKTVTQLFSGIDDPSGAPVGASARIQELTAVGVFPNCASSAGLVIDDAAVTWAFSYRFKAAERRYVWVRWSPSVDLTINQRYVAFAVDLQTGTVTFSEEGTDCEFVTAPALADQGDGVYLLTGSFRIVPAQVAAFQTVLDDYFTDTSTWPAGYRIELDFSETEITSDTWPAYDAVAGSGIWVDDAFPVPYEVEELEYVPG